MNNELFDASLKELRLRNRKQGWMIGGLTCCLLVALMGMYRIAGDVRTIVTPPNLSKAFWVTRDHVSNEYLEMMGPYIAWLILDVTPE